MAQPIQPSSVDQIRTIGLFAHVDAGKTTLTERILFDTGRQRICGDVDAGTATMDWLREEQQRGISIGAGVARARWRGKTIQLIDTPGHVDFSAEVRRALRVVDGAVIVLDGTRGVESRTRWVHRELSQAGVPCLAFVNKLDRPTADYDRVAEQMEEELGVRTAPLVVPLHDRGCFVGIADAARGLHLLFEEAPEPSVEAMRVRRDALVEVLADLDPELFEVVCEDRPLEDGVLLRSLQRATRQCEVVPLLCGSALHNRGVEPLLDMICGLLPAPTPGPDLGENGCQGLVVRAEPDEEGYEATVLVTAGELTPAREVRSTPGAELWPIDHLSIPHGPRRDPVDRAGVGEVVCAHSTSPVLLGATLHSGSPADRLPGLEFPEPILTVRLEPARAEGLPELEAAAQRLAAVDPSLLVSRDPIDGSLLVAGMGELHLDVFGSRLQRRIEEQFRMGAPFVRDFHGVASTATGVGECERRLGERVIRARAEVEVEPVDDEFVRLRFAAEGVEADRLRAELGATLERTARVGLPGGQPLRGVAITLRQIESDDESGALALEAATLALSRAIEEAGVVHLEPLVGVTVAGPTDRVRSVLADLRRLGVEAEVVEQGLRRSRVVGEAPLRALIGYPTRLRSLTQGEGEIELRPLGVRPREGL